MTKAEKEEQAEAIERLRDFLSPGDTVYTILRHVAKSGMSRLVSVVVIPEGEREPFDITTWVARALQVYKMDRDRHALRVQGCGMDAGFEVVYNLGRVMYPAGVVCAGLRCMSNDHSNGMRERRPDIMHPDSGYAFKHRWL